MRIPIDLAVPPLLTESEHHALLWRVNRLRSMELPELTSRAVEACRHLVLAGSRSNVRHRRGRYLESATCPLTHSISGIIEKVTDQDKAPTIATASEWLDHRVSFFALRDASLGDSIDWHCDYSSGVIGPKKYSALINYRDANRVGDVKYIWELNRLQHLVLLALASVWTGVEAYDKEIQSQTASWHRQNPFMVGLNWKSPLEAAMRLISWALVNFVNPKWSRVFHDEFADTLYQHQYFISKFYSKHSSANNHLIGEMAGLYVASVIWPHFRESRSWRAFARQKLIEECLRQVEADGVGKERATEYQLFILEFFILAGALGGVVGDPFPGEYWQRIGRMAVFLAGISDRNGNLPIFGDGDSAQVVSLPGATQERVQSLVRACQSNNDGNGKNGRQDLRSQLLLWGQKPEEIPLPSLPKLEQELQAFPQGGYYVLTDRRGADNEVMIVFDAGSLGLAPLYAHGHADALSFWLSYGGHEFLIDPGTYCYYTHDAWRAYFRGTAAHNTLRIDGVDQSVTAGRFLWRHIARSHAEHVENSNEFVGVKGFHDGYQRLPDPVIHRRDMRLYKKTRMLVITDFIECKGSHDVEIFFHFSEQCEVRQNAPDSFTALNGDRRLRVRLDSRFESKLYRGSEEPIAGWVSRTFGVKEPSFTIAARTKINGSTQFMSEIKLL